MFTSISHSLCLVPVLSVAYWRAHVLFTLIVCVCVRVCVCVCVCVLWCPTCIVLCVCFVLFRLVYPKLSASLDCHFWISFWYSLTFIYIRLNFFPNCIWNPTFSAKHNNLASVVWHTSLMLFHLNTVTTNCKGEWENVSS